MCLLLCLLYQCDKLYVHVCVCVLERAKHSFFALPNPLSCSVMNKICLNQNAWKITAVCKQNCVNKLTNKGLHVWW